MNKFFYRNWWLFYLLAFLLLGILIYALLWNPIRNNHNQVIRQLQTELENCKNSQQEAPEKGVVGCDTEVKSGGQGHTKTQHTLGDNSGTVYLDYETQNVPDEINIYYDDKIVASTNGLVSGSGSLKWFYKAEKGKPNYCIVEVKAPQDKTVWEYILNCPK